MSEIEVGVVVDQRNEVLTSVASGTNKSNSLTRSSVNSGGVAPSAGVGSTGERRTDRGREGTGSSRGSTGGSGGSGSPVRGDARANRQENPLNPAILLKTLNDPLNFLHIRNTIPEQAPARSSKAAVRSLKVPGTVLVIGLGSPEETLVVLLDGIKDVVDDLVEDTVTGGKELGHHRSLSWGVGDDGNNVERLVTVNGVRAVLELGEDLGNRLAARLDFRITFRKDLSELSAANSLDRGLLVKLVTSSDQGARTGIGEELLLEHVGRDDGNRRSAGKSVEELLDLSDLELGAKLDPRFLHEGIVLFVEVDCGNLLASNTVEETTLLVEVDNLHGLRE